MNDEEFEELDPDTESKLMEAFMVFNRHFAEYVKQSDPVLFSRAVDYAKTFTEEDVSGIKMHYMKDEKKDE